MNGTDASNPPEGLNFTPEQLARFKREQALSDEQEVRAKAREEEYRNAQAAADKARSEEAKKNLVVIAENERETEAINREADRILREGQPFKYFLDTFRLDHAGDLIVARCMALIFAASAVANGDGLHALISGPSGRGKSHSAQVMYSQLPDRYRCDKRFSDKYLYYTAESGGIIEGSVILIDDETLSETIQELLKFYTSNYREGICYGTIIQQRSRELKLPPRISWTILKVDDPGDDQVMNRLIQCRVDESNEKVKASAKKLLEKYHGLKNKTVSDTRREVKICREMWAQIKSAPVAVEVPCAPYIHFAEYNNLRNHELFCNLLMAHTVIHRRQRKEIGVTVDGIPLILATEDDFKEAVLIFETLCKLCGQRNNTLSNEDKVCRALLKMNPINGIFTTKDVASVTDLSYRSILRAIHGRSDKGQSAKGGLLDRCPAIQSKGKRGQYEVETNITSTGYGEITRKEHYLEEVFSVDIMRLESWMKANTPVWLEGFKWEDVK